MWCVSPSFALACRPSQQQLFAQRRRKPELSELAVLGESVAQACVRRAPTSSPEHATSQPSNSSSKRTALPGRRLTQALGLLIGVGQTRISKREKRVLATSTLNQAWVSLLFAGGFVYFVINGVMTGSAILWYRRIERSENPFLFWFSIVSCGMGAVFFLILYFWPNLAQLR